MKNLVLALLAIYLIIKIFTSVFAIAYVLHWIPVIQQLLII